jgi:membrane-bound inhibitor of C-type lysozyme
MNTNSRGFWAIVIIVVLLIIAGIAVFVFTSIGVPSPQQGNSDDMSSTQNINAVFTCDGGKSINATFMNATSATTTGNSVMLSLSDGRQMTLPQTISADGARYANADESFVFWNKGNGAIVLDNGSSTSYNNCVTQTQ